MVKTIDEALDKIYSYVDYSMTHAADVDKQVFTLENIRSLMKKRGNPQKNYAIIHVAGTKGKGSVCAMIASALQSAGLRTGLYTSPHLMKFNERIQVNGKMISDAEIVDLTNKIESSVEEIGHISSFEFMTALAFEYFGKQNVDVAVIETGLGGRLDATNIVDPILTVITSISIDHTNFLGSTIEKIAAEKAGIIKPNVPVICSYQPYPEAVKVIEKYAKGKNSPWIYVPDRYNYINQKSSSGKEEMLIWRVEDQKLMKKWCSNQQHEDWNPHIIQVPLRGQHQMANTAAAFAAISKLRARFRELDLTKALKGISQTFWPCRFETLCESPLLVVDGAHNVDSVLKLAYTLDKYYGSKMIKCIFGASEDKDLKSMIEILSPHVDEFIMTKSTHPRAADPQTLADFSSEIGRKNMVTNSLEEAFAVYEQDKQKNVCYIAAGSLFVAGGIRELYAKKDPSINGFACDETIAE